MNTVNHEASDNTTSTSNLLCARGIALLMLVLLLCAAPLPMFAQTPAPSPVASATPSPVPSVVPPVEGAKTPSETSKPAANSTANVAADITEFDVNGLKVIVKRRAKSQTVAAGLYIRGGARNLTAQNAGIESLMLAAMTEASQNYPRERLRTELAGMGTSIGFDTDLDYSALNFATTRASFDRSFDIFTDVALRPSLTIEDVGLMKERILSSLRDEGSTPDSALERLQAQIAYAGHPYLNRPEGTIESVSRLNVEDVRRYHKEVMQTSRLLLVIVGDLDAGLLRERVAATFGKLPRGDYKAQMPPALSFSQPTIEVVPRQLQTNYVQGLFTAPSLTSEDIYAMRVASVLLRDRIFNEVRVRRNLSYAPNAFLNTQAANVGGIYVTANDANQAVRVMLNEIAGLQRGRVEPSEISAVVGLFLTTYYLGQETNAAQVGELALYELIGGGWRNSIGVLDKLRAVTPADVQRVAQKYIRNIRFVVIGNPAVIDRDAFTKSVINDAVPLAGG